MRLLDRSARSRMLTLVPPRLISRTAHRQGADIRGTNAAQFPFNGLHGGPPPPRTAAKLQANPDEHGNCTRCAADGWNGQPWRRQERGGYWCVFTGLDGNQETVYGPGPHHSKTYKLLLA